MCVGGGRGVWGGVGVWGVGVWGVQVCVGV